MKVCGNYYGVKFTQKDFENIKIAKANACLAIIDLLDRLNLDSELFKHLYDIEIVIDNKKETIESNLESFVKYVGSNATPEIHLSAKYVKSYGFDVLTKIILKEMLLCNRCIMIKGRRYLDKDDPIYCNNSLYHRISMDYSKKNHLFFDTDKNHFLFPLGESNYGNEMFKDLDKKLQSIIEYDKSILNERKFILDYPLFGTDSSFAAIYDNVENRYYMYYLSEKFKEKYPNFTLDDILNNLKYDEVFEANNDYGLPQMCCDYDLSNAYDSCKKIKTSEYVIKDQFRLEELLALCMTIIIYESQNSNLSYERLLEKCKKECMDDSVTYVYEIIKNGGLDFIKWYLFSCYEDEYDNKIEKMLGSDYREFLRLINYYKETYDYRSIFYEEIPSQTIANERMANIMKRRILKN